MSGMTHSIGVLVQGAQSLVAPLAQATGAMDKFIAKGKEANASFDANLGKPQIDTSGIDNLNMKIAGIGVAAAAAGAAVIAGLSTTITSATAFEKEMALVSTMVDTSKVNMGALSKEVKSLGAAMGVMPVDTAKSLYTTMSAGFAESTQATILMTGAMKLARGGGAGLNETVDGLTSVMNSYGMKADEVTGLSDKFLTATFAGKTTIAELAASLGKVTPIASSMGIQIDELLGSVASLSLGGLNTAEAMTGLKGMLTAVIKPTAEAKKAAQDLGISFDASAIKSMGLQKWLVQVADKTGGSAEKMGQLFGNVEGLSSVLALAGPQADTFASIMGQLGASAGATEVAFEKVSASASAGFDRAQASVESLKISIGEVLLPTVSGLDEAFSSAAQGIVGFAEAHPIFGRLAVVLPTVVAGVAAIGGAGLVAAMGIKAAMASFAIGLGPILLIAGGIAVAITALVMIFTTSSEDIGESMSWLTDVWEWTKGVFMDLAGGLAYGLGYLAGIFEMVWGKVASYTAEVWPMIKQIIMGAWNAVMYLLRPSLNALSAIFSGVWNAILAIVTGVWNAIYITISTVWNAVYEVIALVWNLISGLFKTLLQVLTGDWAGAWETLKATAVAVWENIKAIFGTIVGFFTGMARTFWDAGVGFVNAIWEGIKSAWGAMVDGVSDMLSDLRDLLPFSDAKEGPLSNLTGSGGAFVKTFATGIAGAADYAVGALSGVLSSVRELLPFSDAKRGPLSDLTKSGASVISTFADGLMSSKGVSAGGSTSFMQISMEPPAMPTYGDRPSQTSSQSVVFQPGSIVVHVSGEQALDDLETRLADVFSRLALRMGVSDA